MITNWKEDKNRVIETSLSVASLNKIFAISLDRGAIMDVSVIYKMEGTMKSNTE